MFLLLRVDDFSLNTFHSLSNGADFIVARRIREDGRRSFSEAVSLEHINSKVAKRACHSRIETRTAGDEVSHLRAEGLMDFAEQNGSGIDADLAQNAVEAKHHLERSPGESTAFGDFLGNAFVDQIKELRDHGEGGDVTFR